MEACSGSHYWGRELEAQIAQRAREDETCQRFTAIPGVGPVVATAIAGLAPHPSTFRQVRDFAAWLG
ncbi:transposase [Ruegeria hyattellae]|uniref:transposase n=1 Tax=Ruegeria hyattellae TaxID=3233337 RepID=UPI00355AD909